MRAKDMVSKVKALAEEEKEKEKKKRNRERREEMKEEFIRDRKGFVWFDQNACLDKGLEMFL